MAGTTDGGHKAYITNISKYGRDYYAEIGRKGGRNGNTGGFACLSVGADGLTGPQRAILAGTIGGRVSKRLPAKHYKPTKAKKKVEPQKSTRWGTGRAAYKRMYKEWQEMMGL